ncbi:HAMP domain-containing histidine kinase [Acinetobacter sp. C_4_1]|uniref:sensor histidine kinase n=1 Tax=unclassified Acinetobacter TaxID=196816 RepID=UPI0021B81B00|nr:MULTISPECIES: HAMP domain-containing sensor histidine kinase [unclassified Acinetobacter]MCT8089615.1 HAMP domain-containing histidine kinase [Acinetobacter sp. F_3_1]MCT8098334.1 HAMP domain-containing histidine kinase [Acinetobacter sp. C_3_1]MCT8101249.1 HAMP domain-containing histidine kinase [Acinetobacter sp. C_4_1]MCT8135237.1 HAMP domain-containing histidine kinase [Acinetobacter sp. T_3_1]
MSKAVSLQSRLIKTSLFSSMLAGVLALLLFVGISLYQTMQLQDQLMDEIADMLLIPDISTSSGQQVDELSDEFDIQYQLKDQQQVLSESENFHLDHLSSTFKNNADEGYDLIWHDQQLWRIYTSQNSELNTSVLLLQPMGERFKALAQNVMGYGLILIVLWFIQWLILHFAVKHQFKVIHQLSREISAKSADDLAPIQQQVPELKELQPMVWQLNQLLQRLEQSLVAEQRFTADASHELRSPLSAIQMRLQVLKRKYPELDQDLASIQNDVNRGTQVLENLLLLARLDPAHTAQLPKSEMDVNRVINEVLQALQPFAAEKNIQIQTQFAENLVITGNDKLIFSCLRNLLDNAIRYAGQNGRVFMNMQQKQQRLSISIEDDGQGVTEEVLQRLGERFYRALGTKTQGSGLGLSICKKIIELHAGEIQFSRSAHGGLKVELQFPLPS